MKRQDTLIHVKFNEGYFIPTPESPIGENHYFGSISAIFSSFTSKEVGVSKQTLYRFDIEAYKPYRNKTCKIYKGSVKRKSGNRTAPLKIMHVI